MMKRIYAVAAASLAGIMMAASAAPANAQSFGFSFGIGDADRGIAGYCEDHPRSRDCREWRRERHDWNRDDYVSFFSRNSGIDFGIRIGNDDNDFDRSPRYRLSEDHIDRCEARFGSYDVRTDTYLGFDGDRHYCNL